jgi:transcription initiation factor TFIIB
MSIAQPFPLANPYGLDQRPARLEVPKQDLAVRLICPECRDLNPNIEEEFSSGDLVCRGCGLVLGDRIVDTRSECMFYFIRIFWSFSFPS